MSTGVDSQMRGGGFRRVTLITPHDTNELPNYAVAVHASVACTADVVTAGGDALTTFNFVAGHNDISVKIVKNNVSNSGVLWALW